MNTAERTSVYLGLGSNLGDRQGFLQKALHLIEELPETSVQRASSIYETEPWGEADQGSFFNAVVEIRTALNPTDLLVAVKNIEVRMGRVSVQRNGPRIIDIDILLYGSEVMEDDQLCIPHPFLPQRLFVLTPLRELAGSALHPVEHATIEEMAVRCPDTGKVWKTDIRLQLC
ncbi:MAG: 2-amino-4-hydroxy-6-hydroxymethyldihydropteridine diphosphokinase [Bacteroidota bacterium]|nr:2-amino-4-hydroxy-6-hydroxymethyldihydropteridine diphosphokinase [Bacteroidota bacterium]